MPTDQSFTITGSQCGQETNTATVSVDPEQLTVSVTGTITGQDGSRTGELDRVTYDEERDELEMIVTTTEREGELFPQCLTEIDYTAEFRFAGTLPSQITVRHRSLGETHTVARTTS